MRVPTYDLIIQYSRRPLRELELALKLREIEGEK